MSNINKKKAALHNLGCKVNAYETDAMRRMLVEDGYEIVDFAEPADVYVVNTCSVTNIADKKSRQMLHRARKMNPDAVVVAAGCYVQTNQGELGADPGVDILIGNNKKHELIDFLHAFEEGQKRGGRLVNTVNINYRQGYEALNIAEPGHTRAFVKVQDGCDQFCSYCIIPYARGRARSRALFDVLSEVNMLAANGCKEVVLSGIHLSSYGQDIGEDLLHLVEETAKTEGIQRIRLGSLEPGIVTEEFAKAISGIKKVCPHFHLSLQSGCDATLRRMNRKYSTQEYEKSCGYLRRYFAHPAITTDVIVGFPGETEEEFAQAKDFLQNIRFYEMHIFKYSRREGTKAAAMAGQVKEEVKARRSAQLIALAHDMSKEFGEYYLGKETEALMEEAYLEGGRRYFVGHTKEYVKVALETEKNLANTCITGRVEGKVKDGLYLLVEF